MIDFSRTLRIAASVMLLGLVITLLGTSAKAADAVRVAHRALRSKILQDAGDRYDVRFLSSHSDRISPRERRVTGVGRFRRHGKTPQRFTYHSTVNIRNDRDFDTGYDIQ